MIPTSCTSYTYYFVFRWKWYYSTCQTRPATLCFNGGRGVYLIIIHVEQGQLIVSSSCFVKLSDSSFATECRPSDDGLGTYCTCIPGYYGPSCERCVSRCKVDVHCDWKGTYCTCIPGHYRPSCERCVSRCKVAVHHDWKGTYCTCISGWYGPSCERCVWHCKIDVEHDWKGLFAPIKSTHLLWPWPMKSSMIGLCVMVYWIKVRKALKPG